MAGYELVTSVAGHFQVPKIVHAGVAAQIKGVFDRPATVAALF
jgi:hypothetical protein